jgi:hypothetical protein
MRCSLHASVVAACLVVAGVVVWPRSALAQADAPRAHVWAAVGAATGGDAALDLQAEPLRLGGFSADASLTMDAPIPGGLRPAIEAGLSWRAGRHAGVQVWLAHDEATPQLAPGTFHTTLDYVTSFPSGSVPVQVHDERDNPWPAIDGPAVDGTISRWALGIEGMARWTRGRLSGAISGGLARVRVAGRVTPLPFRSYWLGGHQVVFSQDHELTTRLGPASAWRGVVGTGLDSQLTRRVAVTTNVRLVAGSALDLPVQVRHITPPIPEFGQPVSPDAVAAAVSGSTVRVPTASVRVLVGLKVGL